MLCYAQWGCFFMSLQILFKALVHIKIFIAEIGFLVDKEEGKCQASWTGISIQIKKYTL